MFIKGHIGLKNYTKVFCRITGRKKTIESRLLLVFTGEFILFGLCSNYSVSFGLTDNLLDVIHENIPLIQDSIAEGANEESSGANVK